MPKTPCKVLFLEEEMQAGGMGMLLSAELAKDSLMQNKTFLFKALRDEFGLQEKDEPMLKSVGLDADSIVEELLL
jgi:deoxyxylulose-5-phosphate synthase